MNIVRHNNHYDINASLPKRDVFAHWSVLETHTKRKDVHGQIFVLQLCLHLPTRDICICTLMHSSVLLIHQKREGLGGENQTLNSDLHFMSRRCITTIIIVNLYITAHT